MGEFFSVLTKGIMCVFRFEGLGYLFALKPRAKLLMACWYAQEVAHERPDGRFTTFNRFATLGAWLQLIQNEI
jgi:hypothetical protein